MYSQHNTSIKENIEVNIYLNSFRSIPYEITDKDSAMKVVLVSPAEVSKINVIITDL